MSIGSRARRWPLERRCRSWRSGKIDGYREGKVRRRGEVKSVIALVERFRLEFLFVIYGIVPKIVVRHIDSDMNFIIKY